MKALLILLLISSTIFRATASGNPDAILGVWANSSNKGHIEIYKHQGKYYGRIIWLQNPVDHTGKPKVDKANQREEAKERPILGLVTLRDFCYDEDQWKDGKVYNPGDGKEYNAYMKMKDYKTLMLRGYVGISLFGKTEVFTRIR